MILIKKRKTDNVFWTKFLNYRASSSLFFFLYFFTQCTLAFFVIVVCHLIFFVISNSFAPDFFSPFNLMILFQSYELCWQKFIQNISLWISMIKQIKKVRKMRNEKKFNWNKIKKNKWKSLSKNCDLIFVIYLDSFLQYPK